MEKMNKIMPVIIEIALPDDAEAMLIIKRQR